MDGEEEITEDSWSKTYPRFTIIKRLLQLNKKEWYIIILVLVAATFAGCGFPLFGYFWGTVYDRLVNVSPSMITGVLNPWGASFVGLGVMMGTAYFLKVLKTLI